MLLLYLRFVHINFFDEKNRRYPTRIHKEKIELCCFCVCVYGYLNTQYEENEELEQKSIE